MDYDAEIIILWSGNFRSKLFTKKEGEKKTLQSQFNLKMATLQYENFNGKCGVSSSLRCVEPCIIFAISQAEHYLKNDLKM